MGPAAAATGLAASWAGLGAGAGAGAAVLPRRGSLQGFGGGLALLLRQISLSACLPRLSGEFRVATSSMRCMAAREENTDAAIAPWRCRGAGCLQRASRAQRCAGGPQGAGTGTQHGGHCLRAFEGNKGKRGCFLPVFKGLRPMMSCHLARFHSKVRSLFRL